MTAAFHIPSDSLITNQPTIPCYVIFPVDNIVK